MSLRQRSEPAPHPSLSATPTPSARLAGKLRRPSPHSRSAPTSDADLSWIYASTALVLLYCVLFSLRLIVGGLVVHYLLYATPFLFLFTVLLTASQPAQNVSIQKIPATLWASVTFVILITIFVNQSLSTFALRDSLIIIFCYLMYALPMRFTSIHVKMLTIAHALVVTQLMIEAYRSGLPLAPNLLTSYAPAEHAIGLGIGFFLIFFLIKRDWLWALFTFVFFILSIKRIAFVAFLVAFIVLLFLMMLPKKGRVLYIILWISIIIPLPLLALNFSNVAEYVSFDLGLSNSPNALTMGRYSSTLLIDQYLEDRSILETMFGSGPGKADAVLSSIAGQHANLHNDYLRVFVDYGYIGFFVIIGGFLLLFLRSFWTAWMAFYFAMLFITDNAIIYVFTHFAAVVVYRACQEDIEPVR